MFHFRTSGLHYVNALGDDPGGPDGCDFGGQGWVDKDRNLLAGVGNYTWRVKEGEGYVPFPTSTLSFSADHSLWTPTRDIPLRFLVHFIGDLHQPLHLAGKMRGGNQRVFQLVLL